MDISLNADVQCTDGLCGCSTTVIVNPITRRVTHVVVADRAWPHIERAVPLDLVEGSLPDLIRLRCTTDELLARVKAVLRRTKFPEEMPQRPFTCEELCIDFARHRVTVAGEEVVLSPTEYRILCLLAVNAGKVITQDHLLAEVWGTEHNGHAHTLRVAVARLRKKLGDDPVNLRFILTRPGMGYTLREPQ